MARLVGAFAFLLFGPFVLLVFTSQAMSVIFTVVLLFGAWLLAYAVVSVGRAYIAWVRRRSRRPASGRLRRSLEIGGWLALGLVAGVVVLPAYFLLGSVTGALDAGGAGIRGGYGSTTGVIPFSGLFALVVVVIFVVVAPLLGLAYIAISAALFWLHRTRLRIDDRPTSVGVGSLIDWLEHGARSTP